MQRIEKAIMKICHILPSTITDMIIHSERMFTERKRMGQNRSVVRPDEMSRCQREFPPPLQRRFLPSFLPLLAIAALQTVRTPPI